MADTGTTTTSSSSSILALAAAMLLVCFGQGTIGSSSSWSVKQVDLVEQDDISKLNLVQQQVRDGAVITFRDLVIAIPALATEARRRGVIDQSLVDLID